jgi:hypothetical protein
MTQSYRGFIDIIMPASCREKNPSVCTTLCLEENLIMFYSPEELQRRKKIKQVIFTTLLGGIGIALAVGLSVLVGSM